MLEFLWIFLFGCCSKCRSVTPTFCTVSAASSCSSKDQISDCTAVFAVLGHTIIIIYTEIGVSNDYFKLNAWKKVHGKLIISFNFRTSYFGIKLILTAELTRNNYFNVMCSFGNIHIFKKCAFFNFLGLL